MKNNHILGVSAFFRGAAATILRDGKIIAAAQEERFTRKKYDASFPKNAIEYCLREAGMRRGDIDLLVFHEDLYKKDVKKSFGKKMLFCKHHLAHAASAFYPSPFNEAAILIVDGLNSMIAVASGSGKGNSIKINPLTKFPNSIGLVYSAFAYYCGFNPDADEYKLMGLAPYGEPAYLDLILEKLIELRADGILRIKPDYFNCRSRHEITNKKFNDLFGGPPREKCDEIEKKHKDMANSIQAVTEIVLMNMINRLHRETMLDSLCMAGELALNCVANGKILKKGPFKNVWIQPAASDAGCALGAAFLGWHEYMDRPRKVNASEDSQKMSLLGPEYSAEEIEGYLRKNNIKYQRLERGVLLKKVASLLADQNIVGWFQGRMEFGPRALGNRSILADPRSKNMRNKINAKVKFRETFRPFAPSVLSEKAEGHFDIKCESPYMLFTANVRKKGFPAITHVDNSARVQTVRRADNPLFHDLIRQFDKDHGCPMVINTSFNRMGEPIVCTPEDAYMCFTKTEMDYLVMGSFLIGK